MKPTKETIVIVLDGLVGIALWVLSWFAPSVVIEIVTVIWGVAQPFVVAWLVKLLKLEIQVFIHGEFAVLRASLRK